MNLRLTSLFFVSILFLASCQKDEDDTGDARDEFTGTWICQETLGDFAPQSYSISVSKSGDGDLILIRGLYNQGSTFVVEGLVDVDQLTLPTQSVDGFTLSGSGTLNAAGDRVDLNFSINDGGGTDNVTANWTK